MKYILLRGNFHRIYSILLFLGHIILRLLAYQKYQFYNQHANPSTITQTLKRLMTYTEDSVLVLITRVDFFHVILRVFDNNLMGIPI